MKKLFLFIGIIFFTVALFSSFFLLLNYNTKESTFSLPPEEKNYIRYTVNKGEITEELVIDGTIRGTDEAVKTISIPKTADLILSISIGDEVKANDILYKKGDISEKASFSGRILSINSNDIDKIVGITYLDYSETNIDILVSQEVLDKIIKSNKILVKNQEKEFEASLSSLSSSYAEDSQMLTISLAYNGDLLINTKVEVWIYGEKKSDVFCVAKEALKLENNRYYLQTMEERNSISRIEVTVGIEDSDGNIEISSDKIHENMEVVNEFNLDDPEE